MYPKLHCHSAFRNIGVPSAPYKLVGYPMPCILLTVRRCEFNPPPPFSGARFCLRASVRARSASRMSEIADTAFEQQRLASKSQLQERSGRESI